jgi:hypothetical protein
MKRSKGGSESNSPGKKKKNLVAPKIAVNVTYTVYDIIKEVSKKIGLRLVENAGASLMNTANQ